MKPTANTLKIGLVAQRYRGDKAATIAATAAAVKRLSHRGARLVILQELHQSHYFCQAQDVANFELAGDFAADCAFWGGVAQDAGVVLVTSLFERRAEGLYHNTAVVFETDGRIAGVQRKMHIPDDPQFCEKFYFTPGEAQRAIDTSVGRLGVAVCWDQWYPEAARILALQGAQILIYPTAIGWFEGDAADERARQLGAWVAVQRGHAVANSLPVVAVNRVGFEPIEWSAGAGILANSNLGECGASGENLNSGADGVNANLGEPAAFARARNNNVSSGENRASNLPNSNLGENGAKNGAEVSSNSNLARNPAQNPAPTPPREGILFWGNSFVFGPQGEEIFRAGDTDEVEAVVEIDLARCEAVRRWWPFLRDRRIDAYSPLLKRYDD